MDFSQTRLSLRRPITSYSKIQQLYGSLIRNRRSQLRNLEMRPYLNVGCGPKIRRSFINLDYAWRPGIDLCWDITKGLPLEDNQLQGIFTEHCLEHIGFDECKLVLEEFFRVLKPGGMVRIVVPDAEHYLDIYQSAQKGEPIQFPYTQPLNTTPMMYVNEIFRGFGHKYAYDAQTLTQLLMRAGFTDVQQTTFNIGRDPRLIVDSDERKVGSLYIEAITSV